MTDTKMRNVELIVGSPVCVMDDLRPESIVNCSAALTGSVGTCVGYVFTYTGSCSWQPLEWQQMVDTMTKRLVPFTTGTSELCLEREGLSDTCLSDTPILLYNEVVAESVRCPSCCPNPAPPRRQD